MNQKQLIQEVRRRAEQLDQAGDPRAIESYAYPIDDSTVGLANVDGLERPTADADSAVFVITDSSVDRDGDRVNPLGVHTDNWYRAGAPVFFSHQAHPYPIGSCINPATGELDVWPERDRIRARIHFDMEDPHARFLAGKVKRGLLRATSIAFVPIQANRREDYDQKAQQWSAQARQGTGGFDFHAVDLTELSLTGVGANPNALLEGAPAGLAKALRGCVGGKCFSRSGAPPRRSPKTASTTLKREWQSLKRQIKQTLQMDIEGPGQTPGLRGGNAVVEACKCAGCRRQQKCPCSKGCPCAKQKAIQDHIDSLTEEQRRAIANGRTQEEQACLDMVSLLHKSRVQLAKNLPAIESSPETPPELIQELLEYSGALRRVCENLVQRIDGYRSGGGEEAEEKGSRTARTARGEAQEPNAVSPRGSPRLRDPMGYDLRERKGEADQGPAGLDHVREEILARYGDAYADDEDWEEVLDLYRHGPAYAQRDRDRRDRTGGHQP
jgi:hypothetical protein